MVEIFKRLRGCPYYKNGCCTREKEDDKRDILNIHNDEILYEWLNGKKKGDDFYTKAE